MAKELIFFPTMLLVTVFVAAQAPPPRAGGWERLGDESSGRVEQFSGMGGVKIAAYIRKPAGQGPFPVVVILHGGGHSVQATYALGRSMSEPVNEFIQAGWAVFSMDFRANPTPFRAIQDEREWQDAIDGIETAKKFAFVDRKRVALMGGSHGATVLSRAASRVDAQAAVLCAPAAINLPEIAKAIRNGSVVVPILPGLIANLERQDGAFISEIGAHPKKYGYHSAFYEVTQVRMPVLIINGQNDRASPISVVQAYADRLEAAGKVVLMFLPKNGPHGFQWGGPRRAPATKEAAEWAVAFIRNQFERVGKPGPPVNERAPDPRIAAIRAKIRQHQPVTPTEREYLTETMVRAFARYARQHPPRDFVPGLVALTDLGKNSYKGERGGLFAGGSSTPPQDYLRVGVRLAREVVPRNAEGEPDQNGKIVLISIGYWNATMEWQAFMRLAGQHRSELNPALKLVDGGRSRTNADPNYDARKNRGAVNNWQVIAERLQAAGAAPAQVQAAWINETYPKRKESFPDDAKRLEDNLVGVLHGAIGRFPNLKLAYFSSRVYAGYATVGGNPEPFCYDIGFAYRWLIGREIRGDPELNYDPRKGPVRAPWTDWSPDLYLWANGVKGRSDGMKWYREDFGADGMHPSPQGCLKIAQHLWKFYTTDPTTRMWFTKQRGYSAELQSHPKVSTLQDDIKLMKSTYANHRLGQVSPR